MNRGSGPAVTRVRLAEKLSLFTQTWSPKIVGQVNDMHVKLAKLEGEFVWHAHEAEDELFLVIEGELTLKVRGQDPVVLGPGDFAVVPRGVEHRPVAERPVQLLMIEPAGTLNTGDAGVIARLPSRSGSDATGGPPNAEAPPSRL